MMALIGIFLITLFMIGWDVPILVAGKQWRGLVVYVALLVLGVGSGSALALGLNLPNPTKLIEFVYHPAMVLVDKILG